MPPPFYPDQMGLVRRFGEAAVQVIDRFVLKLGLPQEVFGGHTAANTIGADHNQRIEGHQLGFPAAQIGQRQVQPAPVKLLELPLVAHIDNGRSGPGTQRVELGGGYVGIVRHWSG